MSLPVPKLEIRSEVVAKDLALDLDRLQRAVMT